MNPMRNKLTEPVAEPDDISRTSPEARANSGWVAIALIATLIALIFLPLLWSVLRGMPIPD